jgi:RNA polymerase sigma factor (TIGR02999 family)
VKGQVSLGGQPLHTRYPARVSDLTRILDRVSRGEPEAADELWRLVYGELRQVAARQMALEKPQTLQPTALVNEAWLRLGGDAQPAWKNRGHFFSAAAKAMQRILVEHARRRTALKRGGGAVCLSVEGMEIPIAMIDDQKLLALDEALEKLATIDAPTAELVKLRFFTGLTFEEAAATLGIAVRTAKDWWAFAQAWLAVEIKRPV